MSERLSITPLGPYIGAQITGADLTRPLSDNQFEQLYHAVLRHHVVFLRDQAITPQQQRALAQRFGELHIHPVYPHAEGVDEIIVLDTHNDNPPDNDNWHTDVTFIQTPPAGAILAAKELPSTGGDTLWASGIAAYEALSVPFRQLLSGLRAEHDFRKSFPEYKYRKTEAEHQRWREAVAKNPPLLHPVVRTHPVSIISGVGRAAEFGVLVRDADALQRASTLDTVVFDKTGTLTEGKPQVVAVKTFADIDEAQALRLAAALEQGSSHPLARAILDKAGDMQLPQVNGFRTLRGLGVSGEAEGHALLLGNQAL